MDSATIYRVIQGFLRQLPSAMKKEQLEDGSEVEYCIYTPHSLGATMATLLLDADADIKKVQDLLVTAHHDDADLRQAADRRLAERLARLAIPKDLVFIVANHFLLDRIVMFPKAHMSIIRANKRQLLNYSSVFDSR